MPQFGKMFSPSPLRRALAATCLTAVLCLTSCRDSEPTPAFAGDVGENDRVLMPPPGAWHDPASAKGQADWHPFKKIEISEIGKGDATASKDGGARKEGAASGGVDPNIEKEIRGLLKDYNGLVAEGKFPDAVDFFIKDEAATAKSLVELLPDVAAKVKELASAWKEQGAALERLAANLDPKSALKLELASLTSANGKKAVGSLSAVPAFNVLAASAAAAETDKEIRFIVEGDVWSIDLPALAQSAKAGTDGRTILADLDSAIADAKAGILTLEGFQKKFPGIAPALSSLAEEAGKGGSEEKHDEPE